MRLIQHLLTTTILVLGLMQGSAWAVVSLDMGAEGWLDPATEGDPLRKAVDELIDEMNAVPKSEVPFGKPINFAPYHLFIDDVKYYVKPKMFMARNTPNEVCHPIPKALAYMCSEGQPFVFGCHLLFFNAAFENVGRYTIRVNETAPHFCNSMPAMGVYSKERNEILNTVQYFIPASGQGAKTVAQLGQGWMRMTNLLRIKAVNGKIEVKQDDSCLGNPNQYESIIDARIALRKSACK